MLGTPPVLKWDEGVPNDHLLEKSHFSGLSLCRPGNWILFVPSLFIWLMPADTQDKILTGMEICPLAVKSIPAK